MTKIAGNILELIGNTPLVKLNKLNGSKAEVLLKLESFNPMSSVKDRIGFALIPDDAPYAVACDRMKHGIVQG